MSYTMIPKGIAIHHTGQRGGTKEDVKRVFDTLQSSGNNIGAHFIIDRDGSVIEYKPPTVVLGHYANELVNFNFVGIELCNAGFKDGYNFNSIDYQLDSMTEYELQNYFSYPKAQIDTLIGIIKSLAIEFNFVPSVIPILPLAPQADYWPCITNGEMDWRVMDGNSLVGVKVNNRRYADHLGKTYNVIMHGSVENSAGKVMELHWRTASGLIDRVRNECNGWGLQAEKMQIEGIV